MSLIKLDAARAGMVLETDVTAAGRSLLATAGTELTESYLRVFRRWGVLEIAVSGVTADDAGAEIHETVDPQVRAEATARVDQRFRLLDRAHPLIAALAQVSLGRLTRHHAGSQP